MTHTLRIPAAFLATFAALACTLAGCDDTTYADELDRQAVEDSSAFAAEDDLLVEDDLDDADDTEPAEPAGCDDAPDELSDSTDFVPLEEALLELYSDPDFDQRLDLLATASADQCYEDLGDRIVPVHCADAIQAYQQGDRASNFLVAPNPVGSCESCVDFCRWSLNCVMMTSNTKPYNKGMGCQKWWGCDWDGGLNCVSSC